MVVACRCRADSEESLIFVDSLYDSAEEKKKLSVVVRSVAGGQQIYAGKSFAVRFVLLATEGLDVIFLLPALPDELLHPLGKLQLRRDLVVYYLCFNIVLLHYISLLLYFKFFRDAGS